MQQCCSVHLLTHDPINICVSPESQLQGPDDSVVKYARTEETGEPMCD